MTSTLEGIKVLDLSRILAGPWCTMTLGDLGAEVWKIENPAGGDETRNWLPPDAQGVSTYYLGVNRNKKSLAVDLRSPEGREIVLGLARKADVVVENFRPASAQALGLDEQSLRAVNPRLIHCSISGYGRDSRFAARPGYDLVFQAETGFMAITGEAGGEPMRLGTAFIDVVAGMNAVQAILAALYARERTQLGQSIDIGLFDSGLQVLANVASSFLNTGIEPRRHGNAHPSLAPYETFKTADGRIVLAVGTDEQYRRLCMDILRTEELWTDERFQTNHGRVTHRGILIPALQSVLRERLTQALLAELLAANIPAGEVRNVSQAFGSAEAQARNVIQEAPHERLGSVRMVRSPLRFSATSTVDPTAPPELGEHTREVLTQVLGYPDSELKRLVERKVIRA